MSDQAPVFTEAARKTLEECVATFAQRGGEYADCWNVGNQVTIFLDVTLRDVDGSTPEGKRLLHLASLCDTKLSRMIGPFKRDTLVDLINYAAVYAQLRTEYDDSKT